MLSVPVSPTPLRDPAIGRRGMLHGEHVSSERPLALILQIEDLQRDGLSIVSIGRIMGLPRSTVSDLIRRAPTPYVASPLELERWERDE